MTIANSNFEEWFLNNPKGKLSDFKMEFSKMSESGTLFDVEKLFNITKNYISCMTSEDLYNEALPWMKEFDQELYELMVKYPDYTKNIFSIERYQEKPRKDYSSFSDIRKGIWYMYDELFTNLEYEYQKISDKNEILNILKLYFDKYYDINDDKETWFNKVKMMCDELGYASNMKDYKKNPEKYKGNVADISTVIRVSMTTRSQTPDLYEILKLLGRERIEKRIDLINN
jgi:glutamyl-tRNA synthetase